MSSRTERQLERWQGAGLIDASTAARIRDYEVREAPSLARQRLPALAFAAGGLLLAAGVLLFVAAHWDRFSPGARFALVGAMVGGLPVAGAFTRAVHPALATTLAAVGTVSLGAGIFLAGQIFHLQEHWPAALLLWALGAGAGVLLARDWPQVLLFAVLAPAWLAGEWFEFVRHRTDPGSEDVVLGLLLLAIVYLVATPRDRGTPWRHALARLGAAVTLPLGILYFTTLDLARHEWGSLDRRMMQWPQLTPWQQGAVLALCVALPLLVGWMLRRRQAWPLVVYAGALLLLAQIAPRVDFTELLAYVVFATLALGLVGWGLWDGDGLRINVGLAAFGLTVLAFYFTNLYDRLGRSLGLIGLGVLFLGGGLLLHRARQRLLARLPGAAT